MSILKVDTINEKTSGNGVQIAGHVVQVGHTYNHQVSSHQSVSSTTLVGSGVTCVLTPKSTSNKFIVSFTTSMAQGNATAAWLSGAMKYKIGSGSYVYVDDVTDNNQPYSMGYSDSGNKYAPLTFTGEVDITSTSAYTFEPHFRTDDGSLGRWCHIRGSYSLLVMEIAQ